MLTKREEQVLQVITNYIDENEFSPSIRDIRDIIGCKSTNTVYYHLKRLEKKGYIERKENSLRALRVIINN